MKEHPILFSGEMVRAILEERKTQTRRVIKPAMWPLIEEIYQINGKWAFDVMAGQIVSPYGYPGDRLWVRETFQIAYPWGSVDDEFIGDDLMEVDGRLPKEKPENLGFWWDVYYRADEPDMCSWWRPSIFMPRWASRLTLKIITIWPERLQDIWSKRTDDWGDIFAEGIPQSAVWNGKGEMPTPLSLYIDIWNSINAKRGYGWEVNPWCWVIEFKRVEKELA